MTIITNILNQLLPRTYYFIVIIMLILSMFLNNCLAKEVVKLSKFVSIKSDEVNSRTGPNVKYPIRWVYVKKGEPIEIIAEFEQWKKVKDVEGDIGWIHETMISNKRYAIIISDKQVSVLNEPKGNKINFIVEPNVRALLLKCRDQWCEIKAKNYSGWLEKNKLWGANAKEDYN